MVDRIYPKELQLNRANSSDTEAPFLDFSLCISNVTVSTKIYNKRDDFHIVNFPFLDDDVPRRVTDQLVPESARTLVNSYLFLVNSYPLFG